MQVEHTSVFNLEIYIHLCKQKKKLESFYLIALGQGMLQLERKIGTRKIMKIYLKSHQIVLF